MIKLFQWFIKEKKVVLSLLTFIFEKNKKKGERASLQIYTMIQ